MGLRGPAPKSSAQKKLEGTYRRDRDAGPTLTVPPLDEVPAPPAWLSDAAKTEWRRMATELLQLGVLSTIDLKVLEGYCAAYGRAVRAEKATAKDSLTMLTPQGRIPRPEVNIAKQAWAEMRAFAVKLGATPADRTRVKVEPPKPKLVEDPWADVEHG